jgi:hypothetical protein
VGGGGVVKDTVCREEVKNVNELRSRTELQSALPMK